MAYQMAAISITLILCLPVSLPSPLLTLNMITVIPFTTSSQTLK